MPRLVDRNPKYRKHVSGQAAVRLNGHDVYLGPHGTRASRTEYDRVIAEWLANGRTLRAADGAQDLTIVELCATYWQHVQEYYRKPDGSLSGEVECQRRMIKVLKQLYAHTPAANFGPLSLKALRQTMIGMGWCRNYVNAQTNRARRMFKWAESNEMVPQGTHHSLATVDGLRRGRSDARETDPVKPVPEHYIDAAREFMSPQVRAMVDLQLLTGMRPGEIVIMRTCDIDRSGRLWLYRPAFHKTEHHGHARDIFFGPKARAVLEPFLKPELAAYMFSPRDSETWRHAQAGCHRRKNQKPNERKSKRRIRDRYDVCTYRQAIAHACRKADKAAHAADPSIGAETIVVPGWNPNQLRHNAATRLRKEFGIEMTRIILGHRSTTTTEIYAEADVQKAQRIMGEVG